MFRPAHSNRKIVIDVAVASSVKVRNKVRQAKPLVKAMAAADRKWRQNHLRMPAGCDFKAVTFQATGGMSIQPQQMLKRLPQDCLPEHLRVESTTRRDSIGPFTPWQWRLRLQEGLLRTFLSCRIASSGTSLVELFFKNEGHGL